MIAGTNETVLGGSQVARRGDDTIYALASGQAPAAIGIIRVSGPLALPALRKIAGRAFVPRRATLATLRDESGDCLDTAIVLSFPGPGSATGEDYAELHCHGGRAVLNAVCTTLGQVTGLREAKPGEFTRRAFANGRIDLAEAEGLADLLAAETEMQRAAAMTNVGGAVSSQVEAWRDAVLKLSAQLEAVLDFSDEDDDAAELPSGFNDALRELSREIDTWLSRPRSDRLRDGYRVVLAGPPNAGKSTLFNALVESEAAITSPIAGTTRDVVERAVSIEGVPFVFADTAGLRDDVVGEVEAVGIDRANREIERADLTLWLGPEGCGPDGAWEIDARADESNRPRKRSPRHVVSAVTGTGIEGFKKALIKHSRSAFPKPGEATLNARQHTILTDAALGLRRGLSLDDPLTKAEELRYAMAAFDRLIGRSATEDMLDALFARFCIGK